MGQPNQHCANCIGTLAFPIHNSLLFVFELRAEMCCHLSNTVIKVNSKKRYVDKSTTLITATPPVVDCRSTEPEQPIFVDNTAVKEII